MSKDDEIWERLAMIRRRARIQNCMEIVLIIVGFLAGFIAAGLLRVHSLFGIAVVVLVFGGTLILTSILLNILSDHIIK